jgi:radical SAM superfamily enzyme YgiQ (UPF0313 family)
LLKARQIIGIDISKEAIAYAQSHYPGISFIVGDMACIPLTDDSIDTVVCLEGFEHVTKNVGEQFLDEAIRVAKPGGLLVMTVPVILEGGHHSGNPYHLHEPSRAELERLLCRRFETVSMDMVQGADGCIAYFVGRSRKTTSTSRSCPDDQDEPRKSRILLTTSAAPAQSPFSTKEKRPPLGIGYLISVLRDAGHTVSFIDNYLKPSDFLQTRYLQENGIDFVGIYCNTVCLRDTLRMLREIECLRQTHQWTGKIIVGGPHASVAPETLPNFVDHIVQGEGERAILDIVEGRSADRLVRRGRIENLDELPMVAWDYFVDLPYDWHMEFVDEGPVFTMNTSRGCPFRCTFCSVGSVWGKKYTWRSAGRIVSEIEHLINDFGAKGIYFREDNFTANQKRLREFCNLLTAKGIEIPWVCESRVSTLSRDLVQLMSQAGLRGFYFGVESGSQQVLDALKKDITVKQIENAFAWCHEFGVKAAASMIMGVPGETETDRQQTDELLKRIKPTVTWSNVFVGIPKGDLYEFTLANRLYEYIDDRGLVYLQGHDDRVDQYYRGDSARRIPDRDDGKDWTNKPRVSVLMAVHNGDMFIEEALQSVYDQSWQDFEVVIVDDASTDATPDILLALKDSRTFLYRNQENKGLTRSLNIGINLCRGDYVARMDADDVSYPQRFSRQVSFLEAHPDCVAAGCWCRKIDAQGNVCGAYDKKSTTPDEIEKRLLFRGNSIAHGTAMIRRTALMNVGGYNEEYIYAQDHDLWLRLSEYGDLFNMDEYLVGLRCWSGNITATKTEEQLEFSQRAMREAVRRRRIRAPLAILGLRKKRLRRNSCPGARISELVANTSRRIRKVLLRL